jgi:hypothetical protein
MRQLRVRAFAMRPFTLGKIGTCLSWRHPSQKQADREHGYKLFQKSRHELRKQSQS